MDTWTVVHIPRPPFLRMRREIYDTQDVCKQLSITNVQHLHSTSCQNPRLVTGANGAILWICRQLLDAGYAVRGTVRKLPKGVYTVNLYKILCIADTFESVIVRDVASWVQAEGSKAIKRIGIASSAVSVLESRDEPSYTEKDWSESVLRTYEEKGDETDGMTAYRVSKVLAERKAYDFMEEHKEAQFNLATILPIYVRVLSSPLLPMLITAVAGMGRSCQTSRNASMQALTSCVVDPKKPEECGSYYSDWVDVRDTALAHIRALQVPAAGSDRFLVPDGPFARQDIYDTLATAAPSIPKIPRGVPGAKHTHGTPALVKDGCGCGHEVVHVFVPNAHMKAIRRRLWVYADCCMSGRQLKSQFPAASSGHT
ncbi:hypothetical protein CALCODRAFT_509580 [Calocera cornea HHB12733]|uniref:NAD(P)-binding protein n=1 Tax=Calocera cornea HHB12733 TaxID=1353952 RepID=A0A165F706_9BASI|nr:hypothetical protein CALCODRAFT_509580 [Calocera cornea HHB12733]